MYHSNSSCISMRPLEALKFLIASIKSFSFLLSFFIELGY